MDTIERNRIDIMNVNPKMFLLGAGLLCFALAGCAKDKTVSGGFMDETETSISGDLVTIGGTPVANVSVKLHQDFRGLSGCHSVDSLSTITTTSDNAGHFHFLAKGKGLWHLEARDSSRGILHDVNAQADSQVLGTDTLRPLQSLVIPASHSKVFIAQTNQIVNRSQGLDTLSLPQGSYDLYVVDSIKNWPDTTQKSVVHSLSIVVDSLWSPIGSWGFNKPNSWSDTSGHSIYMTNLSGAPGDSATWINFYGNTCIQLLDQPAIMRPSYFKIEVTVKFAPFIGTQSVMCNNDTVVSHAAWCLNISDGANALFVFRNTTTGAALQIDAPGLVANTYQTIGLQVYHDSVTLTTPITKTMFSTSSALFTTIAMPPTIGCRQNATNLDQFFVGQLDYLTWYSAKK